MFSLYENIHLNLGVISKIGEECQDAACSNNDKKRFAVADGVSLSLFPEVFASLLVNEFCYGENIDLLFNQDTVKDWLAPLQKNWYEEVQEKIEAIQINKWIFRNSFLLGESAFSTFAGIELLKEQNSIRLRAVLIGDSCLFHVRDQKLLDVYLIKKTTDFDDFPSCFDSYSKEIDPEPEYIYLEIQKGDFLILGTDKISEWILLHNEKSMSKWNRCLRWLDKFCEGTFDLEDFVFRARNSTTGIKLASDDVALIVIKT